MQWSGEEKPSDTFQFVTKLGEGSFGVAYKAINNQEKVEVAIKVVYIPGNEAERLKIKKELDVLKRCHHANVVTYYGFAFVRQDMWIIMEYCSGGSVLSLFAYHSPPPTPPHPPPLLCTRSRTSQVCQGFDGKIWQAVERGGCGGDLP